MGLLDALNSDDGMLGMGLLAAAAPSMEPTNGAARLANAMSAYRGMKADQLKQQLGSAQLSEFQTKNQLQQFQLQRLKDWQGLLTGNGSTDAPQPGPDDIKSAGAFVPSLGGMGPVAPLDQAPAALTARPQSGFQFGLRGMPDANSRAVAASMTPDEYMKLYAQQAAPQTDIEKLLTAQGVQPGSPVWQQALAQQVSKVNNIPIVPLRTPLYFDPNSNTTKVVAPDQIQAAYGAQSEATARGKGNIDTKKVWDPNADNGTGGKGAFVLRTQSQIADASTGAAPGQGSEARIVGAGVGGPFGNDVGRYDSEIASAQGSLRRVMDPQGRSDLQKYISDMQRWRTWAAGSGAAPGAGSAAGTAPQQGGPLMAEPPLGVTNAANAAQSAPSKLMADSYGALSNADANYQQSRDALTEMLKLANNKGLAGAIAGNMPYGTRVSPDAAKYEKLHATYVALQGKALGSGGTDAARATINEAVPTYDKPQSAMTSGVNTQLNNLDIAHLKTQFLSPLYQRGDEKAFTQLSAAFDQNIKPAMAPILTLSGAQQKTAVQAAIKADPSLRPNFEWAFNNGLLK